MKGYHFFFVIALIALGASGWYSFTMYQNAQAAAIFEQTVIHKEIPQQIDIMPDVNVDSYLKMRPFSRYEALGKRNIYTKFVPKEMRVEAPKIAHSLPTVQMMPKKIKKIIREEKIAEKVEKKPIYYYRGTMMLEGEEAHIVEQLEPYKTHFLTPGMTSEGVSLVEVERYGISIEDKNGTIYLLPIKKE